jgi:hypothetical protein
MFAVAKTGGISAATPNSPLAAGDRHGLGDRHGARAAQPDFEIGESTVSPCIAGSSGRH